MRRPGQDVTRRPVIGVAWPKPDYIASLEQAGADVRILDPDRDPVGTALEHCDGLLLTGGEDVDPARYGDAVTHQTVTIDSRRDDYELPLATRALAADLPLLAICRGIQLLNVAGGGTLVQDLPSQRPSAVPHQTPEPRDGRAHEVTVTPASRLARLLGPAMSSDGQLEVNSRHHQAVADVAPGFAIAAVAPDGVVEAIERPDATFCVAVQWHPENYWRTGQFGGLFEGLVRAASAKIETRDDLDVGSIRKQVERA
jgi:putative glutamine amidotransferase